MRHRALVILSVLLVALPSFAEIDTIDVVPAATLLYPYFEVDVDDTNGINTLISVTNASASATMVNFTLWTDYGIPTANFNIYLTGYDTQSIDLREVFKRLPPVTATDGQDPNDTISKQGPISQDINFASCSGTLPEVQDEYLSPSLPAAHRGEPSVDYFGAGNCGAYNYGDGIARGFITADVTNACIVGLDPTSVGYFVDGGGGLAGNRNIIMGDVLILDRARDRVFADAAVHIEAAPGYGILSNTYGPDPLTAIGSYTFYSRFTRSAGADNREALPTAWAVRYSATRTTFGYWRDPGSDAANPNLRPVQPFPCGGAPSRFPMTERQIRAYGADGNVMPAVTGSRFPRAAGETTASGPSGLGLTSALGWTFLNLNLADNSIRQSWIYGNHVPTAAPVNAGAGFTVSGFSLGNNAATGANPTIP